MKEILMGSTIIYILIGIILPITLFLGIIIICLRLKTLIEITYRLNENIATIVSIKLREEEKK